MESYIEIPKNVNNNSNYSYELVTILDAKCENITLEMERIENVINGITNRISCYVENIGIKKLAYEIKNQKEGWYVLFDFNGTEENITEIERYLRQNDIVLKFIIIKKEGEM